jgi:hypothetical protein
MVIDSFVWLTPLLVLPLILLFVFVGCALPHSGRPPPPPPIDAPYVMLLVENPDGLAITQVQFVVRLQEPGSTTTTTTTLTLAPPADATESGPLLGDYVPLFDPVGPSGTYPAFRFQISIANIGTWTVGCTVSVSGVTPSPTNSHAPRTLTYVYPGSSPEGFAFVVNRDATSGQIHVAVI